MEWEVLNPFGFCTGGIVKDTRVSFLKGLLFWETPDGTCIRGGQDFFHPCQKKSFYS